IYLAVSATNQCGYCIASHTAAARKQGMTDAMLAELMAVVGMANETNRLASGYQVEIDDRFKTVCWLATRFIRGIASKNPRASAAILRIPLKGCGYHVVR